MPDEVWLKRKDRLEEQVQDAIIALAEHVGTDQFTFRVTEDVWVVVGPAEVLPRLLPGAMAANEEPVDPEQLQRLLATLPPEVRAGVEALEATRQGVAESETPPSNLPP